MLSLFISKRFNGIELCRFFGRIDTEEESDTDRKGEGYDDRTERDNRCEGTA